MFENAHKGVNKIFVAEMLELVGTVLFILGLFMGYSTYAAVQSGVSDAAAGGMAMTALLSILPGAILPVVALILNIIGLYQASKDEETYLRRAFWLTIANLAIAGFSGSIAGMTGNNSGFFVSLLNLISDLMHIVVYFFTVQGICVLAQRVNRNDIVEKGNRIIYIVAIVYAISAIASLFANLIGVIGAVIAGILAIVAYVLYLSFLSQARSALANR